MTYQHANRIFLLFLFTFLINRISIAQNFRLVKDINTATDGRPENFRYTATSYNFEYSDDFAVLNGVSYFASDGGLRGRGLWRSDGTNEGTYQLKDSVNPQNIVACNGKLYFSGAGAAGLWISDGTGIGTFRIFDAVPAGLNSFVPTHLTNFNGTAFFTISNRANNDQLWKTDGTPAGTVMVKDFYDQASNTGRLANFKVIKDKLFFSVEIYSSNSQSRLWVTNGSAAGTYVISNNVFDPAQMVAATADSLDTRVYFSANTFVSGPRSLFVTNGKQGVANAVGGFNGVISYNYSRMPLIVREGVVYFIGRENASALNHGLYKFDVNAASAIQAVKVITGTGPSGSASGIQELYDINGNLFFYAYDAVNQKNQLWKSDGSSSGNVLLRDSLHTSNLTDANGLVYFTGGDSAGYELWISDGSKNGTTRLKDIYPGDNSSNPLALTYLNNMVLFAASDGVHGRELWKSDGTEEGTSLVKDINQNATSSSQPYSLTALNNTVLFVASAAPGTGRQLFKSDGTNSGTVAVNDTIYSNTSDNALTIMNHETYFFGNAASDYKPGLYKSNGTAAGTILVKDLTGLSLNVYGLFATDSLVFFYLHNSYTALDELWRTDGTTGNTFAIKTDIKSYSFSSNMFASTGGDLFFAQNGSQSLWKTDGTVAGTILVKSFTSYPYNLAANKGVVYFSAGDGAYNYLWKSDGTPSGTVRVTGKLTNPERFTSSNGELFFTASDYIGAFGNVGIELFKTDGTENGTVLVKDIHPGFYSTSISIPTSVDGVLFFFTASANFDGVSLWKSDGSSEGTQLVSKVVDQGVRYPYKAVSGNGKLYFILENTLWVSDGTQGGTHRIEDDIFSTILIEDYSSFLAVAGNQLFFTATNYRYGNELYVGTINNGAIAEYVTTANGNWSEPSTWAGYEVPPPGANVLVLHNVTANMDATCHELRVEAPGALTVNDGVRITLLQ